MGTTPEVEATAATAAGATRRRKRPWVRVLQTAASLAIVVGIFVFAIPKIADYSQVLATIGDMTWLELSTLLAVTILNQVSYYPVLMAAMPGLGFWQAAVVTQTGTSIANTLPGGGAIAVGITYTIYRSWGFANSSIALLVLVTGIWNTFLKLGFPVVALALLAIRGEANTALVIGALIGVLALAAGIALFALILWRERFAERIGNALGKVVSFFFRLLRRPPVTTWGAASVRFRGQTIVLLRRRWIPITLATLVSHLALFLVLLIALRHVGVSEQEVSWAEALGVFSFARLVSAVPITPGGLGLVELSYIGGLVLAGRDTADVSPEVFRAQIAAAVLVFRSLTFLLQVPIGAFTYVVWRRNKSWRRPPAHEPALTQQPAPEPVGTTSDTPPPHRTAPAPAPEGPGPPPPG